MRTILLSLIFSCFCFAVNAQHSEAPQNTRFYYDGTILDFDHVQMNLHIEDHEVTGAFLMESTGEYYFVEGRLSKDKSGIGIRIYNQLKQYVASIEASITSEENNFCKKMEGVYKPVGQEPTREILLRKIAEFAKKIQENKAPAISMLLNPQQLH